jgi:hypothetical protein
MKSTTLPNSFKKNHFCTAILFSKLKVFTSPYEHYDVQLSSWGPE